MSFENLDFEKAVTLIKNKEYVELCDLIFVCAGLNVDTSDTEYVMREVCRIFNDFLMIVKPILKKRIAVAPTYEILNAWKEQYYKTRYGECCEEKVKLNKKVKKITDNMREYFRSWLHAIHVPDAMVKKIMKDHNCYCNFDTAFGAVLLGDGDIVLGQLKTKNGWGSPSVLGLYNEDNNLFNFYNPGATVRITKIDISGMTHRVVTLPSFEDHNSES